MFSYVHAKTPKKKLLPRASSMPGQCLGSFIQQVQQDRQTNSPWYQALLDQIGKTVSISCQVRILYLKHHEYIFPFINING